MLLLQHLITFQIVVCLFLKRLAGWSDLFPWFLWNTLTLLNFNFTWCFRAQCCMVVRCLRAQSRLQKILDAELGSLSYLSLTHFANPVSGLKSVTVGFKHQVLWIPDRYTICMCLDKHISLTTANLIAWITCLVALLCGIFSQFSSESTGGMIKSFKNNI